MLVLTRKPGQSVYIGDNVKLTLMEIRGNQVRVGIDAPPNVRIYREEIYLQILEENQAAAVAPETPSEVSDIAAVLKSKKPSTFAKVKKIARKPEADEESE